MQEQYVDFRTARLAAEAGFHEQTNSYFSLEDADDDTTWDSINIGNQDDFSYFDECSDYNDGSPDDSVKTISRPTQDLLDRWLRENFNMVSIVIPTMDRYSWIVYNKDNGKIIAESGSTTCYTEYEMAREEALIEALEEIHKRKAIKEVSNG